MMRRPLMCAVIMALAALTAASVWAAQRRAHSGAVVSVDRTAGTLVVADMGPWRGGDSKKSETNIAVKADSQTKVVVSRRSKGPGPSGWPGEYEEVSASLADIKPGDFVVVNLHSNGTPTATKITRVVPE